MSDAIATIMDGAQLHLAEAPPVDEFVQVTCQDPYQLGDIIGGKHRRESLKHIPVELKVEERCHACLLAFYILNRKTVNC